MKINVGALIGVLSLSACSHGPSTFPNGGSTQQVVPQVVQNGGAIPFRKFAVPISSGEVAAVAIAKDRVWFTEFNPPGIGYVLPGSGAVTEFALHQPTEPFSIVPGPDGNMWFVDYGANKIGVVTLAGAVKEYRVPTPNAVPYGLVAGPDNALWFTESQTNKIGRITMKGLIKEFPLPPSVHLTNDLTVGADKNLWVCTRDSEMVRVTTVGVMTTFAIPIESCNYPTLGSDGRVYAAGSSVTSMQLFAIDTSGVATTLETQWLCNGLDTVGTVVYCLNITVNGNGTDIFGYDIASHSQTVSVPIPRWFAGGSLAQGLTVGADGNLWFGDTSNMAVYERRLMTVSPTTLTTTVGQSQLVTASEANFNGALTAFSQNPLIATVSIQSPGTFKVTGVATGSTIVVITDDRYNSFQVKVTVN